MRTMLIVCGVLVCCVLTQAYRPLNSAPRGPTVPEGKIRITPVELFPQELKRLEPHLELSGACFKVEYNGPELSVKIVVEIWKNGTLEGHSGGWMALKGPFTGELSVTAKNALDDEGNPGSRIVTAWGGPGTSQSTRATYPTPDLKDRTTVFKKVERVTEIAIDQEIAVWGMLQGKAFRMIPIGSGRIQIERSIAEVAKEAEYAIIWKLVPGREE